MPEHTIETMTRPLGAPVGDPFPWPLGRLHPSKWHPKSAVGDYVQNRLIEWNWTVRHRARQVTRRLRNSARKRRPIGSPMAHPIRHRGYYGRSVGSLNVSADRQTAHVLSVVH